MPQLERVAVEHEVLQVAHRRQLAQELRVDREFAVARPVPMQWKASAVQPPEIVGASKVGAPKLFSGFEGQLEDTLAGV